MERVTDWQVLNFRDIENILSVPSRISSGGFMLCLKGECKVVINVKQYHIKANDLVVVFPSTVIQKSSISDDFDCIIIEVSTELLSQIRVPNKGLYFSDIRLHPSISITDTEKENILSARNMLDKNQDHIFKNEINQAIIKILTYELAAIYSKREPNLEQKRSRDDMIFTNYMIDLFNDYRTHRNLKYYAEKQQITPSHLSKAVKRISTRSASEWLIEYVINNIKITLQTSNQSIGEISELYNFPNSSFFSQFFKKYTGLTPKNFILKKKNDAL